IRDGHVTGVQTCALPISNGAREMQRRRAGRAAGQHERTQRREARIERVDLLLQARDLTVDDREALAARSFAFVGRAQIGAEVEQDRKSTRLNSSHVAISY